MNKKDKVLRKKLLEIKEKDNLIYLIYYLRGYLSCENINLDEIILGYQLYNKE